MQYDFTLMNDKWRWNTQLFDSRELNSNKSAVYEANGNQLTIGPWIAGTKDVRLVYTEELPLREGSINGRFKTEDLYPREANVWIIYRKNGVKLFELNFWFGISDIWTDFSFPVFSPPDECDRIEIAFGFHMKTHGRLFIQALTFGEAHDLQVLNKQPPVLTRPAPLETLAPGKNVRLEKEEDGCWWLVDTEGKAFYSAGCAMYNNKNTPEQSSPVLDKIGFNTIANGSSLDEWMRYNESRRLSGDLPYYQFYRVNTDISSRSPYVGLMNSAEAFSREAPEAKFVETGGFNHAFPDPFDPNWESDVKKQIHSIASVFQDKSYYMLWMAANERSHWNLYRYVWSPYCAEQFDKFLREKYFDIEDLNSAWNSRYSSFEHLKECRPEPHVIEGQLYEDFNTFSRIILRTFNEKIVRIIHEEDPGRLVFSNRFMIHEVRGVFDNLDLYECFDGIAVNIYPSNDCWGLDLGERQYLKLLHEKTKKPLMICEWSVPARDSHLYDDYRKLDWSYPQVMRNQQERAAQVAQVAADLYNMPFVVGAHWFSWGDFLHKTRQSNRGIFQADGVTPWEEVQNSLRDIYGINMSDSE